MTKAKVPYKSEEVFHLTSKIIGGYMIKRPELAALINAPLVTVAQCADAIRRFFCGNTIELCSIFNGKSGACLEDCKFCAQSGHYKTCADAFPLVKSADKIVEEASYNASNGIRCFSIVTSGRGQTDAENEAVCNYYKAVKDACDISLCASHGILTERQLRALYASGVRRYHCNIETSEKFFPKICTTHTFADRVKTIETAQNVGMEICSGGIFGMGETWDDRLDMALILRKLDVKSVPINILRPIEGTPLEGLPPLSYDEIRRIVALFRFVLPKAQIRMAAGRGNLNDKGASIFLSGANATISGGLLTTSGTSIEDDRAMLEKLGFKIKGA